MDCERLESRPPTGSSSGGGTPVPGDRDDVPGKQTLQHAAHPEASVRVIWQREASQAGAGSRDHGGDGSRQQASAQLLLPRPPQLPRQPAEAGQKQVQRTPAAWFYRVQDVVPVSIAVSRAWSMRPLMVDLALCDLSPAGQVTCGADQGPGKAPTLPRQPAEAGAASFCSMAPAVSTAGLRHSGVGKACTSTLHPRDRLLGTVNPAAHKLRRVKHPIFGKAFEYPPAARPACRSWPEAGTACPCSSVCQHSLKHAARQLLTLAHLAPCDPMPARHLMTGEA